MNPNVSIPSPSRKRIVASARVLAILGALLVALLLPTIARADNVAQIMTTKYFAPETVTMLKNRAAGAGPYGLQNGDTVSYIIEFTPAANGSDNGLMGYITDYIPANTVVVGASIVQPDGAGGFVDVAPTLPGLGPDGVGTRGVSTYFAPFTGSFEAACTGSYLPDDCNGRIAQLYADTGIFYSTDSRTALYVGPDTNGIIEQGTNGYLIAPSQGDKLNVIVGNPITGTNPAKFWATTHNSWDACNVHAFGTKDGTTPPSADSSCDDILINNNDGVGVTPFNVGSGVAGPLTGYTKDYSNSIGPWQRIKYAGSRIGTNTDGPSQTDPGTTTILGSYTNSGYALSTSNPLPSDTNAVRWAVGGLTVGQVRYVKISLKLTANPPTSGLINNCEVFGGDTATDTVNNKNGKDNTWRYHVPSVCTTNSNLYILKQVVKYTSGGTTTNSDGAIVPVNAKLTYRITYLNTSTTTQTNVLLSDVLPSFTSGNCVSNATVITGSISAVYTPPSNPCNSPRTITFNNGVGVSLAPGVGGEIELDVQLSGTSADDIVINRAKICSNETPNCSSANAISTVGSRSNLSIQKTASPASVSPGGTVAYTLTIKNNGTAAASNMVVTDILPGVGNSPCTDATRFKFISGSSTFGGSITGVTPTVTCAPTLAGFTGLNRDQVVWTFTGQTLAVNASFTITFNVTVGSSVPVSTTPYVNYAQVVYNAGTASTTANTTVVAPTSAGLVSFNARTGKNGVSVKWETGSELNIIGFNVWRKNGKREWKKLNAELIDAKEIGTPNGAKYNFLDKTSKAERTYRYKLEIITTAASEWSEVVKNK